MYSERHSNLLKPNTIHTSWDGGQRLSNFVKRSLEFNSIHFNMDRVSYPDNNAYILDFKYSIFIAVKVIQVWISNYLLLPIFHHCYLLLWPVQSTTKTENGSEMNNLFKMYAFGRFSYVYGVYINVV